MALFGPRCLDKFTFLSWDALDFDYTSDPGVPGFVFWTGYGKLFGFIRLPEPRGMRELLPLDLAMEPPSTRGATKLPPQRQPATDLHSPALTCIPLGSRNVRRPAP